MIVSPFEVGFIIITFTDRDTEHRKVTNFLQWEAEAGF